MRWAELLTDAFILAGLGLVAFGLAAIYWPLAPIVCGIVLTGVGLWRLR